MGMLKTSTQSVAVNTINTITITSPNTKTIFIKGYLCAFTGTDAPANTVVLVVKDEDGNELWQDGQAAGATNEHTSVNRLSFTFPGKGLPIPPGKNAVVTVAAAGAATSTELNVMYYI
jgi:hypothetical protein